MIEQNNIKDQFNEYINRSVKAVFKVVDNLLPILPRAYDIRCKLFSTVVFLWCNIEH